MLARGGARRAPVRSDHVPLIPPPVPRSISLKPAQGKLCPLGARGRGVRRAAETPPASFGAAVLLAQLRVVGLSERLEDAAQPSHDRGPHVLVGLLVGEWESCGLSRSMASQAAPGRQKCLKGMGSFAGCSPTCLRGRSLRRKFGRRAQLQLGSCLWAQALRSSIMLARLVGQTFMLSTNLSGPLCTQLICTQALLARLAEESEAEVAVVALLDRGLHHCPGRYLGALCHSCNIAAQTPKTIPVVSATTSTCTSCCATSPRRALLSAGRRAKSSARTATTMAPQAKARQKEATARPRGPCPWSRPRQSQRPPKAKAKAKAAPEPPMSFRPGHTRMGCDLFCSAVSGSSSSTSCASAGASRRFASALIAIRWAWLIVSVVSGTPGLRGKSRRAVCKGHFVRLAHV